MCSYMKCNTKLLDPDVLVQYNPGEQHGPMVKSDFTHAGDPDLISSTGREKIVVSPCYQTG